MHHGLSLKAMLCSVRLLIAACDRCPSMLEHLHFINWVLRQLGGHRTGDKHAR